MVHPVGCMATAGSSHGRVRTVRSPPSAQGLGRTEPPLEPGLPTWFRVPIVQRPRATDGPPVTRILPPGRWPNVDVAELLRFREVAYRLVRRDLTLRYRQTFLGVLWVFLQPLLAAGAFTLIFGRIAELPAPDGVPYFLLALWGATAFTAFSACLTKASASLVANAPLVSKVYFPRLLLPVSTVGSVAVDVLIASLLGVALGVGSGLVPPWQLLTLPLWLSGVVLLGLGVGLLFAPLQLRYRDVGYVLPLVAQLLLYVSPVGYSLASVPEDLRALYLLNPLAPLLEGVRWAALDGPFPPTPALTFALLCTLVALVSGGYLFRRQERIFADVV